MMPSVLAKLARLGATRGPSQRRAFRRPVPGRLTACHVRVADAETHRSARVQNLTQSGAGIVTDREFMPGTRLVILLVNAAHTFALSIEMEVIRCSQFVNGSFLVGGQFGRHLVHDELLPFMR